MKAKPKYQEQLYKEFYAYGMKICMRYSYSRDEAAEILNDSFMKVFAKIHLFDEQLSFKAWLRKIVIHTAIDYYRRRKKLENHLEIAENDPGHFDLSGIDQLQLEDILKLLNELPEIYRMTFNLYEIEGYSHEEIAEMLNIGVSTSRSNLTRAKQKLRALYHKYYKTDYGRAI